MSFSLRGGASPTLVIVTALPWERRALLRALPAARKVPATAYPTWRIGDSRGDVALVQCGMGQRSAAACANWLCAVAPQAAVVCIGCAGGLRAGLHSGAAVVASDIITAKQRMRCCPEWTLRLAASAGAAGLSVMTGGILSVEAPLLTIEEKQRSGFTHDALAVDMESAALAEPCAISGRTFASGRIILDDCATNLDAAAANAVDPAVLVQAEIGLARWLRSLLAQLGAAPQAVVDRRMC